MTDSYALRHLEQVLAEDDATAELGVHLVEHGGRVFVRGQVASSASRDQVLRLVRRELPDVDAVDELTCAEADLSRTPSRREEIR